MQMLRQGLHQNWTVTAVSSHDKIPESIRGRRVPARVPGCVHTDLLRAGLIEDPYFGCNEAKVQWIGLTDWRYETSFDVEPGVLEHERVDLVFDGLDTVATIELNGQEIGRTFNMHHPHRFDVKKLLKARGNELRVTFRSAVAHAREMEAKMGPLVWTNGPAGPFNFIRKMACNFGWDWGPALVTCGMWRGVRLEGWNRERIAAVRPAVSEVTDDKVVLSVDVDLATNDENIDFYAGLQTPTGAEVELASFTNTLTGLRLRFEVNDPELWWPKGHGSQPLYTLTVGIGRSDDEPHQLDEWSGRIGLRTVELDASPDDIGLKFVLKVNGKPIFCKGANWIPDDCFLDRACTPERYRERIGQAVDANMNMLRVWGGGIYETDEFYDICDEMGVMVWQDFLFACAAYPEEEPIRSQVVEEARHNVARLSRHPSLVLWNGCNENVWGYHNWEQFKVLHTTDRTWGPGYYFDLLPKICAELDPSRPYWPASPWSGDPDWKNGLSPNLHTHGNMHTWEPWFGKSYDTYRRYAPRFCSEFGFQGTPVWATMARALPPDQLAVGSEGMKAHQKFVGGEVHNERHLALDFDMPESFDDWFFLMQLNQARAVKTGVEWFRSRQPVCMGTLYWQLNDCWPVTSWAAIDGDGRLKPLWYATRRFYGAKLYTIQPEGEGYRSGDPLSLFVCNDSDEPEVGRMRITRRRFDGTIMAEQETAIDVPERSVRRIALDPALSNPEDPSTELIAVGSPAQATWFFAPDKHLRYPEPRFDASLERRGDEHRLTLVASTLLREVCVFPDRLDADATVNDQIITLLPGEAFTFVIHSAKDLPRERLLAPPVMQCANRIGRRE